MEPSTLENGMRPAKLGGMGPDTRKMGWVMQRKRGEESRAASEFRKASDMLKSLVQLNISS